MLPDTQLQRILNEILNQNLIFSDNQNGRCRAVSLKRRGQPLSGIGSYITGGRFNQREKFQVLYIADSEETARLEFRNLFKDPEGNLIQNSHRPCVPFVIHYQLESILDLNDLQIQQTLQTNCQELTGLWDWLSLNLTARIAPTQELGRVAFDSCQIQALRVPSAAHPGSYNLAIFPDRLRQGFSYVRAIDPLGIEAQIIP